MIWRWDKWLKKNSNFNINLQLDEGIKETLKKGGKFAIKFRITNYIITLIVMGLIIFAFFKTFNSINSNFDFKNN